jgi:hypothetical protein
MTPRWPDLGGARDLVAAWGDWATEMADAFDTLVGTLTPEVGRDVRERRHRHRPPKAHESQRCGSCQTDNCHCNCCLYDADLVVYARAGEERVIPIRITNERARDRDIVLDLSEFATSGGKKVPVQGTIVTPTSFSLASCEHENAVLVLKIGGLTDDAEGRQGRKYGDVDQCLVAYADLRIQGCDVRPVRIAVALLPRDCDAYEVHCACGCC